MENVASKPQSNTQRAITELRALIFSGELAAGSDHLESELAIRLGMSRTPVREAALTLESQGLLEMRPRKGVRIVPVSIKDMREIYDVLTELESLAAESAAAKKYAAKDLIHLSNAIADMEAATAAKDLAAWACADEIFHAELVRLGANSRVQCIVGMMGDQVRRARAITLFMRPLPTKSNDDHRSVYQAIRKGDAIEARRLHRDHRVASKRIMIDLLERHRLHSL